MPIHDDMAPWKRGYYAGRRARDIERWHIDMKRMEVSNKIKKLVSNGDTDLNTLAREINGGTDDARETASELLRLLESNYITDEPRAKMVMVSNGTTGYCKCGACDGTIDPWDRYCKHCGIKTEGEWQ